MLERQVHNLRRPASAVLVYEKANAQERARIAALVRDKVERSTVLTDEQKDALNARMEKADQ